MIIFGGTNVYPAEIEAELLKVPGVADCAVFGIPDDEFGEAVCAFIQPDLGLVLNADAIRSRVEAAARRLQDSAADRIREPRCPAKTPARSSSASSRSRFGAPSDARFDRG